MPTGLFNIKNINLNDVLYAYKTWSLILREENTLMGSMNSRLKKTCGSKKAKQRKLEQFV
jgi:hypothetical protein